MIQIEYKTTDFVWYAMKASYGKAIKAKESLDPMQIENFVPMRYERKKERGRYKYIPIAAIPNLIFIWADKAQLERAKAEMNFLHNMLVKNVEKNILEPIIVPDIEMARFMKVVADVQERIKYVDTAANEQIISKGRRVKIIDGEYKGYEGVLCRPKGSRAKKVLIDVCGLAPIELPVIDVELLEDI